MWLAAFAFQNAAYIFGLERDNLLLLLEESLQS